MRECNRVNLVHMKETYFERVEVSNNKMVSICLPCFNEEGNVEELYDRITKVMKTEKYDYEILYIDNCSTDHTQEKIREISEKDKHVKAVFNLKNYGPDISAVNGIKFAIGDAVIVMASDLQDPPELLPEFLRAWEEGYKMVYGQKTDSHESKIKYSLRSLFYDIIIHFSDSPQYKHVSGIHLDDREVLTDLFAYDDDVPFRYVIGQLGYPIKFIQYTQDSRKHGKSSFNIKRYFNFAMESLTVSSTAPLRMATVIGMFCALVSFIVGCVYLVYKIIYWNTFSAGLAPLIIGMFFMGAVQLICIGLAGEYIAAIHRRVSSKPRYRVKEKINIIPEKTDDMKTNNV